MVLILAINYQFWVLQSCQSCSAGSVSNSDKSACGKIQFLDLEMALGYSNSNVKQDAKSRPGLAKALTWKSKLLKTDTFNFSSMCLWAISGQHNVSM